MKRCLFLLTTKHGQRQVGSVTRDGDQITEVTAKKGSDLLMARVMQVEPIVHGGEKYRRVSREQDPVAWFEALPIHYNGSYLRAKIIDAGE